ncbi:MAG TPA: hypothetical protein VJR47_15785 [Stellaceae bacterium]|nr:hypothetical protein [Stellaceae bacterium]
MASLGKTAHLALVLAGGLAPASCVVAPPRGEVAFGYSDGYWDRGHHWHGWASADEAARFRSSDRGHYYDRPHTSDRDQGWRDNDQYWHH